MYHNPDKYPEIGAAAYLKAVNARFNAELARQIAGTLPPGHIYRLGHPSAILLSAGLPNLPIEMAASRLLHKSNQENHPFHLQEIRDLPKAIQNPMAVFRSATHIGSSVILTRLTQGSKNFVVAIETNKRQGKIVVNSIRSIHPRTTSNIAHWINEGLLEFADTENLGQWLSDKIKTREYLNSSTPADVRHALISAAKILQNFENPKCGG